MAWSDYFPFLKSPALKAITDAIDNLQSNVGTGSPDNWYDTIDEIRALTGYSDTDIVGLNSANIPSLYQFDETEITLDDGNKYLTPNDITEPAPGRWVKRITFSIAGHTHTDKLDKPQNPVEGELYVFNSDGDLVSTGKSLSDFVETEEGKGLSSNNFDDDYKRIIDDLPEDIDVSGKMDMIQPTTSNIGNSVTISEEGNSQDSGIKPIDQVHPVSGDEQSAEQGETISYPFRAVTEWKTARIYLTLYTSEKVLTAYLIFDNAGNKMTQQIEQVPDTIKFTSSVIINNNIPTLNLLINNAPETVFCTRPKIIYN